MENLVPIRKFILCLTAALLPLAGWSQMEMTARGNLFMGSLADPSLDTANQGSWFINQYKGLRWAHSVDADEDELPETTCVLNIDMTKSNPCISGNNEVDFRNTAWNTLMVRHTFINMSGTLSSEIPQPLSLLSAVRQSFPMRGTGGPDEEKVPFGIVTDATEGSAGINYGSMISLLASSAQMLQGRIISQQNEVDALTKGIVPETSAPSASDENQTVSEAGQVLSVKCSPGKGGTQDCFATLSTLAGKIVRKEFLSKNENGSGSINVSTEGLEAGTYIITLFENGQIKKTHYIVVTEPNTDLL